MNHFEKLERISGLISQDKLRSFVEGFEGIAGELKEDGFERSDIMDYLFFVIRTSKALNEQPTRRNIIKLSEIIADISEQEFNTPNEVNEILTAFQRAFKNHVEYMRDEYDVRDYNEAASDFEDLLKLRNFENVVDLVVRLNQEEFLDEYLDKLEVLDTVTQKEIMAELGEMVSGHLGEIYDVLETIRFSDDVERTVRSTY